MLCALHDVGKVGIADEVLLKREELSPAEWEEMKRHPEIGYRIVSASPDLAHIAKDILHHHEWWNGGGYPQGLKGEEIPLRARILAIVDAFDAMTHQRPYRTALSYQEAMEELERYGGIQFDPQLVQMFKQVLYSQAAYREVAPSHE